MTNGMSERVWTILERRAEVLARQAQTEAKRTRVATVVVLRVGTNRLGFPVEALREIVPRTRELALPGLPPWIVGVVQIRHELVTVVDLARRVDAHGSEDAEYLAVAQGKEGAVAILAHEVIGLRRVYADELAPGLLDSERLRPLSIQGVTKDLTTIVDVNQLCASTTTDIAGTAAATVRRTGAPAREDD